MATARTKRPLVTRTNDVDRLASKLGSTLKLTDVANAGTRTRKGTRIAQPQTKATKLPDESRAAAMKSVNNALQSLAPPLCNRGNPSHSSYSSSATAGRAALNILRKLDPQLVDTERAALCMAGKLLNLNAYDAALGILEDVRSHLPTLYDHEQTLTSTRAPVSLLQLPLPSSSLDSSVQACIRAYLSHSISLVAHVVSTKPDLSKAFYETLDGSSSLRSWATVLTSLPHKSLDALLKRAYVALTTTFASPPMTALYVLKIRFCALRMLLLSSELDMTPFWEQCLKYATSYVRDEDTKEKEKTKVATLLSCFESIDKGADGRREGKGWIAFCEYWLALAKRAEDMQTLTSVAVYIRDAASSSSDVSHVITRTCTNLTQLTAIFDQGCEDYSELSSKANAVATELQELQAKLSRGDALDNKLCRIVERCRKGCSKALSRCQDCTPKRGSIIEVLLSIIAFLERTVETTSAKGERSDATISALDSLFQLATSVFHPQNADSCDQAYNYLIHAVRLIERSPSGSAEEKRSTANYLRCVAGAFANLAGALYKAERHGFAIRFLLQACPLSIRASDHYSQSIATEPPSDSDKDREVWSTHRSQTYRRWELLGVCYVKTGDRRQAHDAFVQGVVSYPFEDDVSMALVGSFDFQPPSTLANAIDRLTHLATSELRLDPTEVSLRKSLLSRGVSAPIVGSILIRQATSLLDRSKPHIRIAISTLLSDALDVYDSLRFPIRRARTLVLVLEHTYYGANNDSALGDFSPETIIQEAEVLLSEKASEGEDTAFTHLRSCLKATILLWATLHDHRASEPTEQLSKRLQLALNALEVLVAEPVSTMGSKGQNRGRGRKVMPTGTSGTKPTSRIARSTATSSSKPRSVRPTSVRRPPAASNLSDGTNATIPRSPSSLKSRELSVSECTSLAELLLMVAELLDLSGLAFMKVQLLVLVRRLLGKVGGIKSEMFLRATSMLAHLFSKLGKITLATNLLVPLVDEVRKAAMPTSSGVLLLLRYAELLTLNGDTSESISAYEDAARAAEDLPDEDSGKGVSAAARIRSRAVSLERIAIASHVYAAIQDAKNQPVIALKALLQALRLLNRATDTLARLNSTRKPDGSSDPFAMSDVKDTLPGSDGPIAVVECGARGSTKSPQSLVHLDALEWRIANSLFETQLALSRAYALRGSVREAEYFEQQAEELAHVLGSPTMTLHALLQKSELKMGLRSMESSLTTLEEATRLAPGADGLHEIDVHRALGDRLLLCSHEKEAQGEFDLAAGTLAKATKRFGSFDKLAPSTSKSEIEDAFVPVLQAKILRQKVWLLRDTLGDKYEELLEKLFALAQRPYIEMQINSMLGRLALYDIHERFRADMSLSSLAESTIALPLGMSSEKRILPVPPQDILDALQQADEHYVSDLSRFSERDSVANVRFAAVAEALISTYQASIGVAYEGSPAFASHLLDMACSITVRRELIDAISFKIPDPLAQDDMRWPSEGSLSTQRRRDKPKGRGIFDDLSDDDDGERSLNDNKLREYWDYVLKKHQSEAFVQAENIKSEIDDLPEHWMAITISLTSDKNALLLSRQRPKKEPMVFCVPLKGRQDEDEDGHFSFDNAMAELSDIIRLSDDGARGACQIKSDDKEAKVAWWASRKQLDQRMKDLVENIEFCWLGAFKTILSQPRRVSPEAITNLRTRFEKVFKAILGVHEKKSKKAKLQLDTNLLELFAALPPTCRDEELQDLIYFVLDLYHFHGLPVALAEVDIDLVVLDLRSALEEFHSRNSGGITPEPDAHTFLVLDKNVQGIPWESLPVLRGHSVSRVPSISFIADRLAWARSQRGLSLEPSEESTDGSERIDRVLIDPSKGYYLLNPSGDLSGTEGRFKGWVNDLKKVGWDGVIGKEPSEQQFLNALSRKDLVIYFGHGGAEQYARSHRIRHLQRCAATMLWGCSSGSLREMGDFDRVGTPNNYMMAGCPSLVANLWDVTDRDIDKFAQSVFTKLRLEPEEIGQWQKGKRSAGEGKMSIVAAIAQSRDVCKLKYLTGAAVVVYGIPYYL
ncbi:ESP1 [Sanghuangporus vaninii]